MLSLLTPSRREFFRVGGLALGGLSLPQLFCQAGSPLPAANSSKPLTDQSVIFLFLHGGPSQIETFDPKMGAPAEIRSVTGEVKTSIPGVTFGGSFPKLAARADRFTMVRSFVTGDGNHDIKPIVSRDGHLANLGSAFASVAGGNHPQTGLPTNIALFPQSVDPNTQPMQTGFGNFLASGPFGTNQAPFVPGSGGAFQKNLSLAVPQDRIGDRRSLLSSFDQLKAGLDQSSDTLDGTREKAFRLLLGGVADAFDLAKEDPKVLAAYDTEGLVKVEKIDKKWKNHNFYADNTRTLGKLLLLARRCVERGAGFVTVTTNFVWDMHADVNNATMTEGMGYMAPSLDHALSAFLDDLKARGLQDKILLVVCGEMGRTPKINKNGGRDHWGGLAPLLLAGGGLNMGQVLGQSDRDASRPATEPVRIPNLISTVMHSLFDVGKLRVTRGVSRELLTMTDANPIPGLHRG
ncbi:MAG: DUF1501 domain-containing protein [Fimbriiglobus sp.]